MISITLLSTVATIAVQNIDNNEIELPYEDEYVKNEREESVETDYEDQIETEYEPVEEEQIVASAQEPREEITNNVQPRNNNVQARNTSALEYLPVEEAIVEQAQEQHQPLPQSMHMDARAMLSLINDERANHGLQPLIWSDSLTASARIRAEEITVLFSHTRPDGRRWSTVGAGVAGENIAARQRTVAIAFTAWMQSPSHRDNILNDTFRTVGIAGLNSPGTEHTYYWVQLFGR